MSLEIKNQLRNTTVQVVPNGFRDWSVTDMGRVIASCSGYNARNDAFRIAEGLVALEQKRILEVQIQLMADVVSKNNLWDYFKGVFGRIGKREG